MIDFRYHLVSIVSIFLALAVGIVLGAGPAQGGHRQHADLRGRPSCARTGPSCVPSSTRPSKAAQARDTFTEESNESLLAGPAAGHDAWPSSSCRAPTPPGQGHDRHAARPPGAKIGLDRHRLRRLGRPRQGMRSAPPSVSQLAPAVQAPRRSRQRGRLADARCWLAAAPRTAATPRRPAPPRRQQALEGLRDGRPRRHRPTTSPRRPVVVVIGGPRQGRHG